MGDYIALCDDCGGEMMEEKNGKYICENCGCEDKFWLRKELARPITKIESQEELFNKEWDIFIKEITKDGEPLPSSQSKQIARIFFSRGGSIAFIEATDMVGIHLLGE